MNLKTKRIETPRLILRQFAHTDVEAMYRNWASDEAVTKYLTWPPHQSPQITKAVVGDWIAGYESGAVLQWAIELKTLGEAVGCISVVGRREDISMVRIGYCIGRGWWRQGITSEAFRALIRYFFEEAGVMRVEGHHDVNNRNSGSVMMKCGLSYEGTLRQADVNNQGICDYKAYAILSGDYFGTP